MDDRNDDNDNNNNNTIVAAGAEEPLAVAADAGNAHDETNAESSSASAIVSENADEEDRMEQGPSEPSDIGRETIQENASLSSIKPDESIQKEEGQGETNRESSSSLMEAEAEDFNQKETAAEETLIVSVDDAHEETNAESPSTSAIVSENADDDRMQQDAPEPAGVDDDNIQENPSSSSSSSKHTDEPMQEEEGEKTREIEDTSTLKKNEDILESEGVEDKSSFENDTFKSKVDDRKPAALKDDDGDKAESKVVDDDSAELTEGSSSSDESGSDDDDDDADSHDENDDDDNDEMNGLSDYERLRLERIKRNQQYLASLGLEGKNGQGVLGGEKKKKRRRSTGTVQPVTPRRSSLSRSSKKNITYKNEIDLRALGGTLPNSATKNEKGKGGQPQDPNKKKRKERPVKYRMPRYIYDEFKRISSKRRLSLKMAKKNFRAAERHVKYWRKKEATYRLRNERKKRLEEMNERMEQERRELGGCTRVELLRQIDRRQHELFTVVAQYDRKQHMKREAELARRRAEEVERRKEMLNLKMDMVDALDRFPKALKDATSLLNALLVNRSPRDPPPPRRSKRKTDEIEEAPLAKKQSVAKMPPAASQSPLAQTTNDENNTWTKLAAKAAAMHETVASSPTTASSPAPPAACVEDQQSGKRKKELTGRNVGGWVSPGFARELDRSWLEQQVPSTSFNFSTYVPQIGDTILYYPGAHRLFLFDNPDKLGARTKNLLRLPLWYRARREMSKAKKEKQQPKKWWSKEWIQGIHAEMGTYPIVCRVQHTHAEFPEDPNTSNKEVTRNGKETTVVFKVPSSPSKAKKKKKGDNKPKPQMRLAVMLRPLTPVVPPQWNETGSYDAQPIELPPTFTVVMSPSATIQPFIVPFAWAYCLTHSMSTRDEIEARDGDKSRGKVKSFKTLGEFRGTFRLEDKIVMIKKLLAKLKGEKSIGASLGIPEPPQNLRGVASLSSSSFPIRDAGIIVDFLSKFLETHASGSTETTLFTPEVPFLDLIRSTLPLSKGIGVIYDKQHRKEVFLSRWELSLRKKPGKPVDGRIQMEGLQDVFRCKMENALRIKFVCAIQDFLSNNERAALFVPKITDAIAPAYSCAVPISMHFNRVLGRLKAAKGDCYYSSVESMLSDIQNIADNCLMYNSPDSDVVALSQEIIGAAKKILLDVYNHHSRERKLRLKAEEERKQFVMQNCDSIALGDAVEKGDSTPAGAKRKKRIFMTENINAPYKLPIYRDWLQGFKVDSSCNTIADANTHDVTTKPCNLHDWVPQRGDQILYNRSFHSTFVKGHFDALAKEQCALPRFNGSADTPISPKKKDESSTCTGGTPVIPDVNIGGVGLSRDELAENVQTKWLHGTVVDVRSTFPRCVSASEGEAPFDTASPILVLSVRFRYSWCDNETHTICWRPCKFQAHTEGSSSPESRKCEGCSLEKTSFILPAWQRGLDQAIESSILPLDRAPTSAIPSPDWSPTGINELDVTSIGRCFDILKRRCLNGMDADFVDPKFCLETVEHAQLPSGLNVGTRSLPSFEDLFASSGGHSPTKKLMSTRGIKKNDPGHTDAIRILSSKHYLPPWSSPESKGPRTKKKTEFKRHEVTMPTPNLCLELVRLRLKHGYYRQREAIVNDLSEAYTVSVIYILSEAASKKKGTSVHKIAKHLYSTKGNSKQAKYVKPGEAKKKLQRGLTNTLPHSNKLATDSDKNAQNIDTEGFNEDDARLISQIDKIRKLYATAIVCVTDVASTKRIFGLMPKKQRREVERENDLQRHESLQDAQERVAVQRIRYLLAAIGRDPGGNPPAPNNLKLTIVCNSQLVVDDQNETPTLQHPGPLSAASEADVDSPVNFPATCIRIMRSEIEKQEDLARYVYGRPGRFFACIRCQAYQVPFFVCRKVRGHSNPDFGFVENFRNFGGVDGLLRSVQCVGSVQPEEAVKQDNDANGVDGNAEPASTSNEDAATKFPDSEPNDCSQEDPSEQLATAEVAMDLATYLSNQAHKLAEGTVRLSDNFIKTTFPIDPADGHYVYCIICGLSGNLLCCDGCSNVVHTGCVGLESIPDEDWFCQVCATKRGVPISHRPEKNASDMESPAGNNDSTTAENATKEHSSTETQTGIVPQLIDGKQELEPTGGETADKSIQDATTAADAANEHSLTDSPGLVVPRPTDGNQEIKPTIREIVRNSSQAMTTAATTEFPSAKTQGAAIPRLTDGTQEIEPTGGENASKTPPQATEPTASENCISDDVFDQREEELLGLLRQLESLRSPPVLTAAAPAHGDAPQPSEETPAAEADDQVRDKKTIIPVGTNFRKTFEGIGEFEGKVNRVPTDDSPYYAVEYEDGDAEELSYSELLDLLPPDVRIEFEPDPQHSPNSVPANIEPKMLSESDQDRTSTRQGRHRKPPNTIEGKGTENTTSVSQDSLTPIKRKRGRPRKNAVANSNKEAPAPPGANGRRGGAGKNISPNKKSARASSAPPGTNAIAKSKAGDDDNSLAEPVQKRGRGRPKKATTISKRGKDKASRSGSVEKRGRSRSRKAPSNDTPSSDDSTTEVASKKRMRRPSNTPSQISDGSTSDVVSSKRGKVAGSRTRGTSTSSRSKRSASSKGDEEDSDQVINVLEAVENLSIDTSESRQPKPRSRQTRQQRKSN